MLTSPPVQTRGLVFAWRVDRLLQKGETNTTLRKLKGDKEVRCNVSNMAENLESLPVKSNCSAGQHTHTLTHTHTHTSSVGYFTFLVSRCV